MTMFHDTFCIPSTYDKLYQDEYTHQNMGTSSLQLDTHLGPIYAQPRSTNSSLSTTSAATTSSNDDHAKTDDHALLSWIQHQLEYYVTLYLVPSPECMDDMGHGKLLLCLIHRFAPDSLPALVSLLEDKSSIECLFLADELAQNLWNTVIDSVPCYLYDQHSMINSNTPSEFVDRLIVPPYPPLSCNHTPTDPIVQSSTTPDNQIFDSAADSVQGEHNARQPTVIKTIDDDHWITVASQSIQHYLQHIHTQRLLDLLTLLEQLAHLHVDFTRLTKEDTPDIIHEKEAHQLLGRVQVLGERLTTVTTETDDLTYFIDLLRQRHDWIRTSLELFQPIYRVHDWISRQEKITMDEQVWTEYRCTNTDVLCLRTLSGLLPAITVLDRLDGLLSNQSHQPYFEQWQSTYATVSSVLIDLHGSAQALVERSQSHVSHGLQQQQWKILARRMELFRKDRQGGYRAVMSLYDQLQSHCISSISVESDWRALTRQWQQLTACMETARQAIHKNGWIKDILDRCDHAQAQAIELEKQMDGVERLEWIKAGVQDLDAVMARLCSLDQDHPLIQSAVDTLQRCQASCHLALEKYLATCARIKQTLDFEDLESKLTIHFHALASTRFDPWLCSLDDLPRLEQQFTARKQRAEDILTELHLMGNSGQDMIDRMHYLLTDHDTRLETLRSRRRWDLAWYNAYHGVKKARTAVHRVIHGKTIHLPLHDTTLFDQAQLAYDQLVYPPHQARQRQYDLESQVTQLDICITMARSILHQRHTVDTYMTRAGELLQSSQSMVARLETDLAADRLDFDHVEHELGKLCAGIGHLWHTADIVYPLSPCVVNDKVRWKVIVALGDLLATLVVGWNGIRARQARQAWEKQYHFDLTLLQQWQHQLETSVHTGNHDHLLHEMEEYGPTLSHLFTFTQHLYPVKIPLCLIQQHQQLQDAYAKIKTLAHCVNYLSISHQLQAECNRMDDTIEAHGAHVSEELVQQWIHHVTSTRLTSLHLPQLMDPLEINGTVWDQDMMRMDRMRAQDRIDFLQQRLATILHTARQIRRYHENASVLTTTLQQLQNQTQKAIETHGKISLQPILNQEQALRAVWLDVTQVLKSSEYHAVRAACQQIQPERHEVMTRQARLDAQWIKVNQGLDEIESLGWVLARWRNTMAVLDKVETSLGSIQFEDVENVVQSCQAAKTTLATTRQSIQQKSSSDPNHGVVSRRIDTITHNMDQILAQLMANIKNATEKETRDIWHRIARIWQEKQPAVIINTDPTDLLALLAPLVDLQPYLESFHHLTQAQETERYVSDVLLKQATDCAHLAGRLLLAMDDYDSSLTHLAPGTDWLLEWTYRLDTFDQTVQDFNGKIQAWLVVEKVKGLDGLYQQEIQQWADQVNTRWASIKNLWTEIRSRITQDLVWQQWLTLTRVDPFVGILEHETRADLFFKAQQLKTTLTGLDSTWISAQDVDGILEKWESMVCDVKHSRRYESALDQYKAAANRVNEHFYWMEQNLTTKGYAFEIRHKIYRDALGADLEKQKQAADWLETCGGTVDFALWITRRDRLEQRFNHLKTSFHTAAWVASSRRRSNNAYIADPQNELDMEIGRIVNKAPYKVELEMMSGGRYRFGDKIVFCRILKSRVVMVRVGGGWTELSQFLREHTLLVGTITRKSSLDSCQEAFLETKRATCPTSGRPLLRSTLSITANAGYKDGDRYIAVGWHGYQHEMKMTPHDTTTIRHIRL